MIRARIIVTLKNGVLDPQGKAIEGSLASLGFDGVNAVRQGKVFDVELSVNDRQKAEADLQDVWSGQQAAHAGQAGGLAEGEDVGRAGGGQLQDVRPARSLVAHKGGLGLGVKAQGGLALQVLPGQLGLLGAGHPADLVEAEPLEGGHRLDDFAFRDAVFFGHDAQRLPCCCRARAASRTSSGPR